MHREAIDLALIGPASDFRIRMMRVRATGGETDGSVTQPAGLALHPQEPLPVIDDEVVSRVLAEGNKDTVTRSPQPRDNNEGCPIADVLRMLHGSIVARADDGPCPKLTTRFLAYHGPAPE
jgi:hypothetical protein